MINYNLIKECRKLVLQGVSVRDIANLLDIPQATVRLYTKGEVKIMRERRRSRQISV